MLPASPPAHVLQFSGGHAHGPNGRFGAWTVTVDATGTLLIRGQVLGRRTEPGPVALSPAERQSLAGILDGLSSVPSRRSERPGIPDEALLDIAVATPAGPRTLMLWHGEARALAPVAALLGWLDAVLRAHAGHTAAFT
ncbi:hypothetical protein WME89_08555 [Sorangium sp. So ce321]|uniref:hypothetical protein n=1 Tax=Sorangium sp. So ce321 TaxID=3133300 RepID=UPI003F61B364